MKPSQQTTPLLRPVSAWYLGWSEKRLPLYHCGSCFPLLIDRQFPSFPSTYWQTISVISLYLLTISIISLYFLTDNFHHFSLLTEGQFPQQTISRYFLSTYWMTMSTSDCEQVVSLYLFKDNLHHFPLLIEGQFLQQTMSRCFSSTY